MQPNSNRRRWLKTFLERDFLSFSQYIFKRQTGYNLLVADYHKIVCNTLQRVESGEIRRLIINIPPSYTKTELAVVSFISHGLALNKNSRFIHVSYSEPLVLNNSSRIKEIVTAEWYMRYWPWGLRQDSRSKSLWANEYRGGLYSAPAGGTITGFHAGRIMPEYSGALVIDDPIKVEDSYSRVARESRNAWINNTIRSRLAKPDETPMVMIMQRVHADDPTGFLLRGGSGDLWHHLCIPARYEKAEYPSEYTHGIPIDVDLPEGPIWPLKHDDSALERLRKADKYTFSAQYMQKPTLPGGSIFEVKGLQYYSKFDRELSIIHFASGQRVDIRSMYIIADTAHKTGEHNDFSVFALWGLGSDRRIYLIDLIREKLTSPELKRAAVAFAERWAVRSGNRMSPQELLVEDKASGIGLIQEIREVIQSGGLSGIKLTPIPRNRDKAARAYSTAPAIAEGRVVLPREASYIRDFVKEIEDFTETMSHKHDDQVDTMMDAIEYLLQGHNINSYVGVL